MNGPLSVVGIAAIQLLRSALAAFLSGAVLSGEIQGYLMVKRALETYGPSAPIRFEFLNPLVYLTFIFFPMAIGLLGMASSIGLLGMREWARKATIFLATFPVSVCVLLLILRPKTLFLPDPGQGAMLAFGGGVYLALLMCLLIVLIPISIWFSLLAKAFVLNFGGWSTLNALRRSWVPHPFGFCFIKGCGVCLCASALTFFSLPQQRSV